MPRKNGDESKTKTLQKGFKTEMPMIYFLVPHRSSGRTTFRRVADGALSVPGMGSILKQRGQHAKTTFDGLRANSPAAEKSAIRFSRTRKDVVFTSCSGCFQSNETVPMKGTK